MGKRSNPEFDVGQGAYDGAEIAELCDLFIMNKIVEKRSLIRTTCQVIEMIS